MAIGEQFNLVSLPSDVSDALAALQENFYFLGLAQAQASKLLAGWDTVVTSTSSPLNYALPDYMTLTKTYTDVSPNVTKTIRIEYTYTGSNATTIVFKFGDGTSSPELVTVTGGTMTCTYDGSGNLITATSA